jgi:hypothetical protein
MTYQTVCKHYSQEKSLFYLKLCSSDGLRFNKEKTQCYEILFYVSSTIEKTCDIVLNIHLVLSKIKQLLLNKLFATSFVLAIF